jgi:hypothetical protein
MINFQNYLRILKASMNSWKEGLMYTVRDFIGIIQFNLPPL